MNPRLVILMLGFWLIVSRVSSAQSPSPLQLETQAIARVQQMAASQFDPALPNRPFGKWLSQIVGDNAGLSWQLTDCGEQTGTSADAGRDFPACVEATAILPNDRMVVVTAIVGTFKQGLSSAPRINLIVVEEGGQMQEVKQLRELPAAIRRPMPRVTRAKSLLPQLRTLRFPLAPLKFALLPPPAGMIQLAGSTMQDSPPPPSPASQQRVSEGALLGSAVVKVTPVYPAIARQINASGEVKVQVTIGEDGRVTEAAATSGHPILRSAAEDAARRWVFKPAMLNGHPVQTQGVLTFLFTRPQ